MVVEMQYEVYSALIFNFVTLFSFVTSGPYRTVCRRQLAYNYKYNTKTVELSPPFIRDERRLVKVGVACFG